MSGKLRLGFIGIGIMGSQMTLRLLERGWPVTAWNLEPEALDKVTPVGAVAAASPAAVAAVLRYGAEGARSQGRRLVAVLGGMFELGAGAREYHREAGRLAGEVGVDLLVCVGDEARWYAEAFPGEARFYEDAKAAAEELANELQGSDYVVVKGSRGVGLDRLTRKLKERLALV